MTGLMTYRLMKECVAEYAKVEYGDSNYVFYLNRIYSSGDRIDKVILDHLIEFLNKWPCRLSDTAELRKRLTEALGEIAPMTNLTREIEIEDVDINFGVVGENQARIRLKQLAHVCFERLMAVVHPSNLDSQGLGF